MDILSIRILRQYGKHIWSSMAESIMHYLIQKEKSYTGKATVQNIIEMNLMYGRMPSGRILWKRMLKRSKFWLM